MAEALNTAIEVATETLNQERESTLRAEATRAELRALILSEMQRDTTGLSPEEINDRNRDLSSMLDAVATTPASKLSALRSQFRLEATNNRAKDSAAKAQEEATETGQMAENYDEVARERVRMRQIDSKNIIDYLHSFDDPNLSPEANLEINSLLGKVYDDPDAPLHATIDKINAQPDAVKKEVYKEVDEAPKRLAALIEANKGTEIEAELTKLQKSGAINHAAVADLLTKVEHHGVTAQELKAAVDTIVAENDKKVSENIDVVRKNIDPETKKAISDCSKEEIANLYKRYQQDPSYKKSMDAILDKHKNHEKLTEFEQQQYGQFIVGATAQKMASTEHMLDRMEVMAGRYNELQLKSAKEGATLTDAEKLEQQDLTRIMKVMNGGMETCGQEFTTLDEKAKYIGTVMKAYDPKSLALSQTNPNEFDRACIQMAAATFEPGAFEKLVGVQLQEANVCYKDMLTVAQQQTSQTKVDEVTKVANTNNANGAIYDQALRDMAENVRKGYLSPEEYVREMKDCQDMYNSVMKANCAAARKLAPQDVADRLKNISDDDLTKRGLELQSRLLDPNNKTPLTQEEKDIVHVTSLAKAKTACYLLSIDPKTIAATLEMKQEDAVKGLVDALVKSEQFSGLSKEELTQVATNVYENQAKRQAEQAKQQETEIAKTLSEMKLDDKTTKQWDLNGDGKVDVSDIVATMKKAGLKLDDYDIPKDGHYSAPEMTAAMSAALKAIKGDSKGEGQSH